MSRVRARSAVVLLALLAWGNRYAGGSDGPTAQFVHRDCGAEVHLVARCDDGHDVAEPRQIMPRPGPGARLR